MDLAHLYTTVGIWLAALLTLCTLSFLYKDNPFYRFAESLFIGVSVGFGAASVVIYTFYDDIYTPVTAAWGATSSDPGAWWVIVHRAIPCVLGMMMLARFVPKLAWLSRIPMSYVVGFSAGIGIGQIVTVNILPQIQASVDPLVVMTAGDKVQWFLTVSRAFLLVGMLSVLAYFFFSKEHKGTYGKLTRVGVYFLMVGFGASFGNTIMARMSLLIGRIQFLLEDWLGTMGVHIG
jgi:hypothetical protein